MAGIWVAIAAANGLISVGAGALGAHALRSVLTPEKLASYEVAVRYQMYHALALLAVAWLAHAAPSRVATASGVCFLVGTVLFSGSIHILVFASWRWLGPVTPVGGVLLMTGWLLLAIAATRLP